MFRTDSDAILITMTAGRLSGILFAVAVAGFFIGLFMGQ